MSKEVLGFISFLQKEFAVIEEAEKTKNSSINSAETDYLIKAQTKIKKEVYKKTKLQKVLDAFIEDAKEGESTYIDDELIKKWQQASLEQKNEILDSFVKRHKNKKASLDLSSIAASEINGLTINYINVIVASCIVFAFLLTSIIALSNPKLINIVGNNQDNLIASILGKDLPEQENRVFVREINKQELGEYIRQNKKTLRPPIHRDQKTFAVSASDVRGRVAGAYEPNNEILFKQKQKNKDSILDKAGEFMYKLADKQIELSLKLGEKIKAILN